MKDPYVYEGTNVLINLKDLKNQNDLDEYESSIFKLSFIKMKKDNFNLKNISDIYIIHKILFEKIYNWAGQTRTINIEKPEYVLNGLSVEYDDYNNIDEDIKQLNSQFKKVSSSMNSNEIIKNIVVVISKLWQIHAFREGNTRTVGVFLFFWMKDLGLSLNSNFIGDNAKFFRNALVLASIGEYSEYNHLEDILNDATTSLSSDIIEEKYSTIKGYDLKDYKYNYHHVK